MPTAENTETPKWWADRVAHEIGDELPLWRRHLIACELWQALINQVYYAVLLAETPRRDKGDA